MWKSLARVDLREGLSEVSKQLKSRWPGQSYGLSIMATLNKDQTNSKHLPFSEMPISQWGNRAPSKYIAKSQALADTVNLTVLLADKVYAHRHPAILYIKVKKFRLMLTICPERWVNNRDKIVWAIDVY